jgi:HEXXH motif-containing protein
VEAQELLWSDTGAFEERLALAPTALAAASGHLAEHPDLCPGVESFLEDHAILGKLSAPDRRAVLTDPQAFYWGRLISELVQASLEGDSLPDSATRFARVLGASGPRDALEQALRQAKRLVLAGCVRAGHDVTFREPLEVVLPLSIAGGRLSLMGFGPARLLGFEAGAIRIRKNDRNLAIPLRQRNQEGPRVATCPRVRNGSVEIWLQPHVCELPGVKYLGTPRGRRFAFQRSLLPILNDALERVGRHAPLAMSQIPKLLRRVAFRDPQAPGPVRNASHSDLPGFAILQGIPNAHHVAEMLLHELHHQRLFALEEGDPLLDTDRDTDEARFYSPWRDDPRPLRGILHATYVHFPVTRFWIDVGTASELAPETRALARDRAARGLAQLGIGLHQLRRHAAWTPAGRHFLRAIEDEHENLLADFASSALPDDPPATTCRDDGVVEVEARCGVYESLRAHVRSVATQSQAEDVLRHAI